MDRLFLYGTLRHTALLEIVLGRDLPDIALRAASLRDHAVFWARGESFPLIAETPGGRAPGLVVEGLSGADLSRLDFYEGGFGYGLREVAPVTGEGPVPALCYFPDPGQWRPGVPWVLEDWVRKWGRVTEFAAEEVMSYFGILDPAEIARRFAMIRGRAASRARAPETAPPATLRSGTRSGAVRTEASRRPYANYFTLEEHDLSFPHFDGSRSAVVTRAGFVSGDAVTVLPYDPMRDRVMVIEQFRFGPYLRGDPRPWVLEPIAGRIDAGESPEDCARREAREETGLTLGRLEKASGYYSSPGATTEFLISFIALADLPDDRPRIGGVADEAEDIRAHVIGFDRLMDLVASGEAGCGPLVLSALWLARHRERLRAGG